MTDHENNDALTLDPPGAIVVVGAGPLGIEAALYGRFLGYDVQILEADAIGSSLRDQPEVPLPMLPDRCLSPLAQSALQAQQAASSEHQRPLPTTFGQWIDDALVPLNQSDLLRNRLLAPARVTRIDLVAVEAETDDEDTTAEDMGDIPPDFELTYQTPDGQPVRCRSEAVIIATGANADSPAGRIELGFETPADYFFQIGRHPSDDAESGLRRGFREIVEIYAGLIGRADLDLYRPRRL